MSKRPRPPSKPEPTPDPPASLVNLLQTDSAALEYFSALHANIDFDLNLWKKEALDGRKEIRRLHKLLNQNAEKRSKIDDDTTVETHHDTHKSNDLAIQKRKNSLVNDKNTANRHIFADEPTIETNDHTGKGRDFMYRNREKVRDKIKASNQLDTANEGDSDFLKDLEDEYDTISSVIPDSPKEDMTPSTDDSSSPQSKWFNPILAYLCDNLQRLGVSLEKVKEASESTPCHIIMENDNSSSLSQSNTLHPKQNEQSLVKLNDVDVYIKMMRALRLSIRAPVSIGVYPFSSLNYHPCYLESTETHPAYTCIKLISRLLTTLDLFSQSYFGGRLCRVNDYTTKTVDDKDDKTSENDTTNSDDLIFCLEGRQWAETIISSLEGEMCYHWCVADKHSLEKTVIQSSDCNASISQSEDVRQYGPINITISALQGRFFQLAERASTARIISLVHLYHQDYQRAAVNVIQYILQHTSIIYAENCMGGPLMSLCVLEALLTDESIPSSEDKNDKCEIDNSSKYSWFQTFLTKLDPVGSILGESLAMSIKLTTQIFKWRSFQDDVKKRCVSAVELAAYGRLCSREPWLLNQADNANLKETISKKIKGMLGIIYSEKVSDKTVSRALSSSLMIYLIMSGDLLEICEIMTEMLMRKKLCLQPISRHCYCDCILSCCKAYTMVEKHLYYDSPASVLQSVLYPSECLSTFFDKTPDDHKQDDVELNLYMILCCIFLADGYLSNKFIGCMLRAPSATSDNNTQMPSYFNKLLAYGAKYPQVRVINLARRSDRLRTFYYQARDEKLLVALAVSSLPYKDLPVTEHHFLFYGMHAFDGQGSHVDFEKNIAHLIEPGMTLASYVSTHWRPRDLRAFDSHARSDDSLVRMSPSERACALSHISSWVGVQRTLEQFEIASFQKPPNEIKTSIAKLVQISGFASGHSLLPENAANSPSPVIVIMEDDAILLDRFSDRLELLLRELPRDFHFCSLGYGRPMNAPLVKYSGQLGIPTCQWYLTGYVLSLAGARYLLESLPCVGPIDSWIGMKMTANWDNIYGQKVGVGVESKSIVEMLPPRKELNKILRFRAFAALVPLCSQKLASTSGGESRWRDRDTDITYSGNF